MTIGKTSAMSRLPPRSPTASLGTRVNRPAPVGDEPNAPPENLLESGASASTEVTTSEVETEAPQADATETTVNDDLPPSVTTVLEERKAPRKARGPNKPKVTLGAGEAVDVAALRIEARELEQKGKQLAAEYSAALSQLRQQYETPLSELRQRYVAVQETLAQAAFSL